MFNSLTSLFLVLTIASIPGQLVVLFVVTLFQRTRFASVDAKVKKHLLLSSYFLALVPIVYLITSQVISLFASMDYGPSQFNGAYYAPDISGSIFRNEWVMPMAMIWFIGVLFNLYRSRRRLMDFRDKMLLEGTLCSIHQLDVDAAQLPARIIDYLSQSTIIKHPEAQSPLVFGYRKRFLIIPDQTLTQKQLHMILSHEMTHLMHKDLWIKLLAELTRLVFFYNPIFIYASQLFDDICEELCDRAATAKMSSSEKKEYGYLLLNLLEQAEPGNKMTQAALSKDKKQLKNRLQAILHPQQVSRFRQGFASLIVVIVMMLSISAIVMIIPQANEWNQSRQIVASYEFEQDIYPTTTYIVSNDSDYYEMTYPEPLLTEYDPNEAEDDPYPDDMIVETTTFVSNDEYIINQTTTVVD